MTDPQLLALARGLPATEDALIDAIRTRAHRYRMPDGARKRTTNSLLQALAAWADAADRSVRATWTSHVDARGVVHQHEAGLIVVVGPQAVTLAGTVAPSELARVARDLVALCERHPRS